MGIAKTISAIGEFDFYSGDYKVFASTFGNLFNANVEVYFWDHFGERHINEKKNELLDMGCNQTLSMTANYFRYDEKNPSLQNSYCTYELKVLGNLHDETAFGLEFIPNGIFKLENLPFGNAWHFFIENILGLNDCYYESHADYIREALAIRNGYMDILKKINCSQVIIWTDANYETEEQYLFDIKPNRIDNLKDIIDNIYCRDGITLYNFIKALKQDPPTIMSLEHSDYLKVAFLDNFTDIY